MAWSVSQFYLDNPPAAGPTSILKCQHSIKVIMTWPWSRPYQLYGWWQSQLGQIQIFHLQWLEAFDKDINGRGTTVSQDCCRRGAVRSEVIRRFLTGNHCGVCHEWIQQRNGTVVTLTKLLSLAAQKNVILTTFGEAIEKNVFNMMTFPSTANTHIACFIMLYEIKEKTYQWFIWFYTI